MKAKKPSQTANRPVSKLRVLLVDDAQIVLDRLGRALKAISNVDVIGCCRSCREAIRRIDALRPDLVVLDVSLPDGNGYDVLQHIHQHNPKTIVYVFSNDASDVVKRRFVGAGATRFFDKPMEFEALCDAISNTANGSPEKG